MGICDAGVPVKMIVKTELFVKARAAESSTLSKCAQGLHCKQPASRATVFIHFNFQLKQKKSYFFTSIHLDISFCHLEVLHFWLSLFNEAAKRNDPSRGFHQLNMHAGVPTWGRSAPLIHKWSQYFILICSVLQSVWHGRVPKPQRALTKAGHLQMLTPLIRRERGPRF